MPPRRNVLIFHAAALGDFILTWPMALALSRLYPQSRIIYITPAQKGALAGKVLGVESIDIESGWHALYSPDATLPDSCARCLAAAHTIISFVASPADRWAQRVRALSPDATLLCFAPRPPADYTHHVTDYFLDQLTPIPVLQTALHQILRSISAQGISRRSPTSTDILIHPGSGSPQKCWPVEHFAALIDHLKSLNHPVRVLLGEVERERWSADQIALLASRVPVHHPETYTDLLAQLRTASQVIAHDSGPAHLAAIVGIPTLCLFGPTNPAIWRPLGPKVTILHHHPLETLALSSVLPHLIPGNEQSSNE